MLTLIYFYYLKFIGFFVTQQFNTIYFHDGRLLIFLFISLVCVIQVYKTILDNYL